MYDKVTCRIRDKVEIAKHYSGRYGAPGMERKEKRKPTPEEMAKQNHWRRCRDLRRMIELNFEGGDFHVTLTCRPEHRPTKEEAPKVLRKFLAKLRAEYKKQDWELKYIVTCEVGERGAVHWHMITNNCSNEFTDTAKLIHGNWTRGRPYFSILEDSGDYGKLAEYMVKETARRIDKGETIEKMSYSRSRNLIKPKEKREKVRANTWRMEPKIPEGWELVPESLVNGINKFNNLPYQHYVIRRKEKGKDGRSEPVCGGKPERAVPPGGSCDVSAGVHDQQGNADEKRNHPVGRNNGKSANLNSH